LAVQAVLGGYEAAIMDCDPQGTAEAWGDWRKGAPPVVIPAKAASLSKTLERAGEAGADIAFIDTPPLAQADASAAARASDLILVPVRPRAFDLHAVRITAALLEVIKKPAFAIFNGGHPSATVGYSEPEQVLKALGLNVAPGRMADRAPYHIATTTGQAAQEIEPDGRSAREILALWRWICEQTGMTAEKHTGRKSGRLT
jgi:chromosome partitioning protein